MSRPEDNVQYSSDVLDAADPRAQAFAEHDAARNSIDEVLDNWAQKVSPRILPSELGGTLPGDKVAGLHAPAGSRVENSQQYLIVPDYRTPADKLRDFVGAAARRASDPQSYKKYVQQELDKLTGVGEGLNDAKEDVKSAGAAAWKAVTDGTAEKEIISSAATGWKALTDGTVAKFLSRPNAINDPLFHAVGDALNAIPQNQESAQRALEVLGKSVQQASDRYSALPPREQGRVIGKLAFYMFAPETTGVADAAGAGIAKAGIETTRAATVPETIGIKAAKELLELPDNAELPPRGIALSKLQRATPDLLRTIQKHGYKINVVDKDSDMWQYMQYMRTTGTFDQPSNIFLMKHPSKIATLEEFLHGTQYKLFANKMPDEVKEFRVKRFLISHSKMLGLGTDDAAVLHKLKEEALDHALHRGFTRFEIEDKLWPSI